MIKWLLIGGAAIAALAIVAYLAFRSGIGVGGGVADFARAVVGGEISYSPAAHAHETAHSDAGE